MPTSLPIQTATSGEDSPRIRYAYKASLIGSAHRFELTDAGLSWQISGRSGVLAYTDIATLRLSYKPSSMQSRRFRTDIKSIGGYRTTVLSTTWQTASLMTPQDNDYRAFIVELHRRMAVAGSKAVLVAGIRLTTYAIALAMLAFLAVSMTGLFARAVWTGEWYGALFLVGFAVLFTWQIGGFVRRNRPRAYDFDHLPEALLP